VNISKEIDSLMKFISKEKIQDSVQLKGKLESLEVQRDHIKNEIISRQKRIEMIENSEKKSDLKEIFQVIPDFYKNASFDERKHLVRKSFKELN
jgi:hypothetical protein